MRRRSIWLCVVVASVVLLALTGCEREAPVLQPGTPSGGQTLIPAPQTPTSGAGSVTVVGTPSAATPTRVAQANATATPVPSGPVATATPLPTATNTPAAAANPTATATTAPPPQTFAHVVQPGETLASIAATFNTTVEVLKQLNQLDSDTITVGQQLIIPGTPPPAPPAAPPPPPPSTGGTTARSVNYVVKSGDRLYRIGLRFGVPWTVIARANRIVNPTLIQPGQVLVIPLGGGSDPTGRSYTVQAGDTLSGIALKFNTSVQAIMAANNLRSTIIIPGRVLRIP